MTYVMFLSYTPPLITWAYMYTMHTHRFKGISKIRVCKDKGEKAVQNTRRWLPLGREAAREVVGQEAYRGFSSVGRFLVRASPAAEEDDSVGTKPRPSSHTADMLVEGGRQKTNK